MITVIIGTSQANIVNMTATFAREVVMDWLVQDKGNARRTTGKNLLIGKLYCAFS